MTTFKALLTATLAAATLGLTVAATSTPAAAWGHGGHHGGWGHHGGHHGHHGGWGHHGRRWGGGYGFVASGYGGYGGCTIVRRAVVNPYGDVVGYRRVRVCG